MNLAEHLAQNRERLAKRDLAYWKARAEALAKAIAEKEAMTAYDERSGYRERMLKAEARADAAEKHAAQDAKERDEAREQKVAQQARAEAAEEKIKLQEIALNDLCESLNEERARIKELQALLDHYKEGEETRQEVREYGK